MTAFGRRAALLALGVPAVARAQDSLPRQIRFIVGFAPGGANDIMARLIASRLNERVQGTNFIVENRPGAGTLVAAEFVARAVPDGTTFMYASTSTLITPLVNKGSNLDPTRDFVAVAMAQSSPLLLVCRPNFPARTLAEVIAMAKAEPGRLTISHPGTGGINHLQLGLLRQQTGASFTEVPYTGNQPSLTALVRGDVDLASDSMITTRALLDAGSIRAIAVTSAARAPTLPDVPTFAETVPGHVVDFWGGLLAPRGVPEPILDRLNREVDAVLTAPDVVERVRGMGAEAIGGSRAHYARVVAEDWARWGQVVREIGLRAD